MPLYGKKTVKKKRKENSEEMRVALKYKGANIIVPEPQEDIVTEEPKTLHPLHPLYAELSQS